MHERELEDIMMEFVSGEIDVLISTTIIETGLDIPNANTLIVAGAEIMGLSQLYQLRGRVGRSNKTAYAFFMYRRNKILSEEAEKRLKAIREFTEFGAGIKMCIRDRFRDFTLELSDGINVITGPNEAGKSTIHLFIRSMLYGADKKRRGAQRPVYERMRPWHTPDIYGGRIEAVSYTHLKMQLVRDLPASAAASSAWIFNMSSVYSSEYLSMRAFCEPAAAMTGSQLFHEECPSACFIKSSSGE